MGVFKRTTNRNGKKREYWYIEYSLNGKTKWESVGKVGLVSKTDAKKLLEVRKTEILLGKLKNTDIKVIPTFSKFTQDYIEFAKGNKKSWDRDMYAIRKMSTYFNDLSLTDITPIEIEKYKLSRKEVVKTQTINKDLSILRRIFNVAKDWDIIESNPVDKVKFFPEAQSREKILSQDEEYRLYNESPDHFKPILTTALNTGMRYREILDIKWDAVDLETGYLNVKKSKTGKGRKIPINDTLLNCLKTLKSESFTSKTTGTNDLDIIKSNIHSELTREPAVLRGLCLRACGFDSRLRHHL